MPEKVHPPVRQSLDSFDKLQALLETLRGDVSDALAHLDKQPDSQFFRRTLVRASWALLEGVTFGLKQWILLLHDIGGEPLSADDRLFLTEKSFFGNEAGEIQVEKVYESTLTNIKRTFKFAGQKLPIEWNPDYATADWELLRASLELRHRITHPKSSAQLELSETEVNQTHGAIRWLLETFNSLANKFLETSGPETLVS